MALHALERRRKRIAREQDDISALEARIAQASRVRDDAALALVEARAVLDEATAELMTLRARFDAAREGLDELRQSYRRDFMATLPLDVLHHVFDYVAAPSPDHTEYSTRDALAPFVLAAVCDRWRTQALRQASLWTYIEVPGDLDEASAALHRRRIGCLLQRSRSCPLDVVFCWDGSSLTRSWVDCPSYETILHMVSDHAGRWRIFILSLPHRFGDVEHIAALKGPLPLLETCRFFSYDGSELEADMFFPFAPKLRELTIRGPNGLYPSLAPLGLSSLRSLRLWYQLSLVQLIPLLSAVAPTLESLALGLDDNDESMEIVQAPVVLPNLSSFTLDALESAERTFRQLAWVQMPVLKHLKLSGNAICDALTPFLDHIAASTSLLTLGDEIHPYHLDMLSHLPRILGLSFRNFAHEGEPGSSFKVADDFFTELSPDIWPSLMAVDVGSCGTFTFCDGSGALKFIRSRTLGTAGTGGSTPCRLKEFKIGGKVPGWIKAEVKRLLEV